VDVLNAGGILFTIENDPDLPPLQVIGRRIPNPTVLSWTSIAIWMIDSYQGTKSAPEEQQVRAGTVN
jgi:hypothetical protein